MRTQGIIIIIIIPAWSVGRPLLSPPPPPPPPSRVDIWGKEEEEGGAARPPAATGKAASAAAAAAATGAGERGAFFRPPLCLIWIPISRPRTELNFIYSPALVDAKQGFQLGGDLKMFCLGEGDLLPFIKDCMHFWTWYSCICARTQERS